MAIHYCIKIQDLDRNTGDANFLPEQTKQGSFLFGGQLCKAPRIEGLTAKSCPDNPFFFSSSLFLYPLPSSPNLPLIQEIQRACALSWSEWPLNMFPWGSPARWAFLLQTALSAQRRGNYPAREEEGRVLRGLHGGNMVYSGQSCLIQKVNQFPEVAQHKPRSLPPTSQMSTDPISNLSKQQELAEPLTLQFSPLLLSTSLFV